MNILCVIDGLGSGGAQRQLVGLAKGFEERGHHVTFLVYHQEDFYKKELERANIPIIYIIESGYLKRLLKMRRFIRTGDFDAVLSFLAASNFISTLAGFPYRKWRLVVGERSANPNIYKSFKLKFYRWFHLFTDHVVANSNANLEIVYKVNPLLAKKKCRVIYNMIEIDPDVQEFNKNEKFQLLIGASHRKVKNLDGLIEAVKLLPVQYKKDLEVKWFGEKNLDKSLENGKNKIIEYDLEKNFEFHDPISNIYNQMNKAQAIGLFSFYEGFPNFICEGMALERPIICTKVSDIPLLLKDGVNAILCDPENPESIAKGIIRAMDLDENDFRNMNKANQELIRSFFEKDTIIESYLNLLKNEK